MHGDLRLEVWSRPGSNPFEKKDIAPPGPFDFTKRRAGGVGRGELTVPVNYDRINELIRRTPGDPATDVRRLARVFAEGVTLPVYEYFLDVTSDEAVESDLKISGSGVESMMADGIVYPWDWDGQDESVSTFPDWIWGGKNILGDVTGQWAPHIFDVWHNGTSGTFQIGVSINGGAYNYATINFNDGAFQVEQALEGLGNVDEVQVEGVGSETNPFRISILAPTGDYVVAIGTISLGAGQVARLSLVQFGRNTPAGWTQSLIGATSVPHGWFTDAPQVTLGGGVHPALPAECSGWIWFDGTEPYFPGTQKRVRVIPGGIYQVPPLYLYARGGPALVRIIVRDLNENELGSEEVNIPANALTQSVGFQVQIPLGVSEVVFRIGHIGSGDPPPIYIACPQMREGLPATTAGDIFLQLFRDATVDHVADGRLVWEDSANMGTSYLDPSFTELVDSAGVAWDNSEMDFVAKRGQTYLQVLDALNKRGYLWSVRPSNTEGRWLLNLYNPSWVLVDATALQSPAINVGSGVTSGPIYRTHNSGNAVTVEGYQGFFGRSKSDLSIAAIGRREVYNPDRAIVSTAAATIRANAEVTARLNSGLSVAVNIDPANPPIPLTDWDVDWLINVQIPPAVAKSAHLASSITATVTVDGQSFKASFSSESFTGVLGVQEGVRYLLEKYEGFEKEAPDNPDAGISGGKGTMPTITFAAANSSPLDQEKADYICPGVEDGAFIQGYLDAAAALGDGRVVMCFGDYDIPVGPVFNYGIKLPSFWVLEGETGNPPGAGGPQLIGYSWTGSPGATDAVVLCDGTAEIKGMYINGSTDNVAAIRCVNSNANLRVIDCYIERSGGIEFSTDEGWIERCIFSNNAGPDITLDSVNRAWVTNNNSFNCESHFCHIAEGGTQILAKGNVITQVGGHGFYISGTTGVEESFILYNSVTNPGQVLAGGSGIVSDQTNPGQVLFVIGNEIEVPDQDCIQLKDYTHSVIAHNILRGAFRSAIRLQDAKYCSVYGNHCLDYEVEGIILDGDSDENYVSHNILRSAAGPTYGIRIDDATCNSNIVIANDLRAAGGTEYSDAGTGTLNTWPAGAAGDNFV